MMQLEERAVSKVATHQCVSQKPVKKQQKTGSLPAAASFVWSNTLHALARAAIQTAQQVTTASCECSDHATQKKDKHSATCQNNPVHAGSQHKLLVLWISCMGPSPAPFQNKAQLHKIGGRKQGRCYEDDECVLPDSPIEATCHASIMRQYPASSEYLYVPWRACAVFCQLWVNYCQVYHVLLHDLFPGFGGSILLKVVGGVRPERWPDLKSTRLTLVFARHCRLHISMHI